MYPSDLKDEEWTQIEKFFQKRDPRGCKPKHTKRKIVDGILYVNKGGVSWRMLPKDLPNWQTVYDYYRQWNLSGLWSEILDHLNERYRLAKGRAATPTYAILDTQSVKTQYHGEERGFDGGKKNARPEKAHRR
jgi:putative transposase